MSLTGGREDLLSADSADTTEEAAQQELHLARAQGDAYGEAWRHVIEVVADASGEQRAGEYWIGFAVQGRPGSSGSAQEAVHEHGRADADRRLMITVRDAGDGRFVPGARVTVWLVTSSGEEIGPHDLPLTWHPILYHYGFGWSPGKEGIRLVRVRVDPPEFHTEDAADGPRFTSTAEVEFSGGWAAG